MTRCTAVLLLLTCATGSVAASDVVYTKQPRFRIPYHSDPAELQRLGAREIQLYLSVDRAQTWRLVQAVPPDAGKFAYEAPGDGEFWFAVRTLDGQNRLHPQSGAMTPGLKVVVDSRAPDLALSLERVGSRVRLSWRATDPNLDPASLKLEFRQPGVDQWQPVAVIAQPTGQTAWSAPASGTVAVRGTVADRAGNTGSGSAELRLSEAGYAPLPENPQLEGPIAQQPIERANEVPLRIASDRGDGLAGRLTNGKPAEAPQIRARPAANQIGSEPTAIRVVNTRSFNLGYEVEEVGPSGVGNVDFFITEDGGQKWYRYGSDPDLESPFRIDVPGEGAYGFQVRVRSGVGLAADPPRPQEPPSVTVIVDETPPVVALEPPTQMANRSAPVVQIRWRTDEAHPAERKPIDIDYAESPDGPWNPIAREIDDSGSYEWTTGSVPAGKLFVRVSARDAAGNVGQAISTEPVVVDLTLPTARITDIEVEPIK